MGKSLIIKGANFSVNAIPDGGGGGTKVWYHTGFTDNYGTAHQYGPGGTLNGAWSHRSVNDDIRGHTISVIKGIPKAAGTYNFYVVDVEPTQITTWGSLTPAAYITINASKVDVLSEFELSTPITLGAGQYLVHGDPGLPNFGDFLWLTFSSTGDALYYKVGTNGVQSNANHFEIFDFGGYEE